MANPILKLDIEQAKRSFFDKAAVIDQVDDTTRRSMIRFGSFVRKSSQRSIRKARMKYVSELTPEERERWERIKRIAKEKGFRPRRPLKHSERGEVPRSISGLLKKFIFFAFDARRKSVVVGPVRIANASGAPEVLEKGGRSRTSSGSGTVRVERRPYMGPAFRDELPKFPQLLRK